MYIIDNSKEGLGTRQQFTTLTLIYSIMVLKQQEYIIIGCMVVSITKPCMHWHYNVCMNAISYLGPVTQWFYYHAGTYDIQSIQTSTRPGTIAVTCSFTTGSVESSCIVRICEVINGNISMMCQDLSVPRSPSVSETTQELNNLQPGVYAIVGVTVNSSGGEMIPFTSGDLRFLQLQNIEIAIGKLYTFCGSVL